MASRSALVSSVLLSSSSPKLRSCFLRKPEQMATDSYKKHSLRGVQAQRLNALDPDNATILVAGGGGVALETVKQLKDMGTWTYMLQRTDTRRKALEEMNVVVLNGDALDKTSLKNAFQKIDGLDAVVSTVGGGPSDCQADSVGNINLIHAALESKVRRFILVTSVGVGDSKTSIPDNVYEVLAPVLIEKAKAEEELKKHGAEMEYVIIRPGGLLSEPATDCGVLTEDIDVSGRIHREDVAQLVIKSLFTDSTTNKTLHAIDKDKSENKLNPEKPLTILEL